MFKHMKKIIIVCIIAFLLGGCCILDGDIHPTEATGETGELF